MSVTVWQIAGIVLIAASVAWGVLMQVEEAIGPAPACVSGVLGCLLACLSARGFRRLACLGFALAVGPLGTTVLAVNLWSLVDHEGRCSEAVVLLILASMGSWALGLILAMVSILISLGGRRQDKQEHCRCGYDLTGNTSGTCPECGERI